MDAVVGQLSGAKNYVRVMDKKELWVRFCRGFCARCVHDSYSCRRCCFRVSCMISENYRNGWFRFRLVFIRFCVWRSLLVRFLMGVEVEKVERLRIIWWLFIELLESYYMTIKFAFMNILIKLYWEGDDLKKYLHNINLLLKLCVPIKKVYKLLFSQYTWMKISNCQIIGKNYL